jgi:hypothetical protein
MFTDQLYKVAAIALLVALIGAGVTAGIYHSELTDVKKENTALVSKVATLEANIVAQNTAIEDLGLKTKRYELQLSEAYNLNKDANKKLQLSLIKIQQLSLPATCEGKLDALKQGLMEFAK